MIMDPSYSAEKKMEAWKTLVHVCRQWRSLVFGSPRRLELRLVCTPKTPIRDKLDIWPALRLVVAGNMALSPSSATDNVIAVLGHNHVCQVGPWNLEGWQLREVLAAMQVPIPGVDRPGWGSSHLIRVEYQSFPIRSWVDLPDICSASRCVTFHFRDCQNCFCLLLALSL